MDQLRHMFGANSIFRRVPSDGSPNQLYFARIDSRRIGVVVTIRSPLGDFALNKSTLDRLLTGLQTDKIDEGFVVQALRNEAGFEYFDSIDVRALEERLRSSTLRGGSWGEYYWVAANFETDKPF